MNKEENIECCWTVCSDCFGRGKKTRKLKMKAKLLYQLELDQFEQKKEGASLPVRPKGQLFTCPKCQGCGIVSSETFPEPDSVNYPNVAIVGGGIGGVALAVACLHRGIPFTLYERDKDFSNRSQGYGLTLQQATKAIKGLGILSLPNAVVSTRHVVHTPEGKVVGEWGMRKWVQADGKSPAKKTNMHIARQSLRGALLEQLGEQKNIQWDHQLIDFSQNKEKQWDLNFLVNGEVKTEKADLVVGADGIRSTVRKIVIGEETTPLQYLGCIVILGICQLDDLQSVESELLDSETVFQTANGHERIYVMPYDDTSVMWQLSFPIPEVEAKIMSSKGVHALKEEAIRKTDWHDPIPQIIAATPEARISGYPVYDRELLNVEWLSKKGNCTLLGDAAHPMSPFKGQGANQALLDALSLARGISFGCRPFSNWRAAGLRTSVLQAFESEMVERSTIKVQDSAEAAQFLHSEVALYEGNEPRGRCLKRKES